MATPSPVYLFKHVKHGTQNIQKIQPVAFWQLYRAPNSFSTGAPPWTPLGELTALPRPSSWFKGAYF